MDTSQLIETAQPIEYWVQLSDRWERSGNYLGACDAALLGLEQHSEARQLQYRAILNSLAPVRTNVRCNCGFNIDCGQISIIHR